MIHQLMIINWGKNLWGLIQKKQEGKYDVIVIKTIKGDEKENNVIWYIPFDKQFEISCF